MATDDLEVTSVEAIDAAVIEAAAGRVWARLAQAQGGQLAADAEKKPGNTIAQLVEAGLLPPQYGPRPDGSRTTMTDNGPIDSLRGRRGRFLPIADAEVAAVTPAEARDYEKFREYYLAEWGRANPVTIAISRSPLPNNREHLVLDVHDIPVRNWYV